MSFIAPTPALTALPEMPSRNLPAADFEAGVHARLDGNELFRKEMNAMIGQINALKDQLATLAADANAVGVVKMLTATFSMSATSITTLSVAVFDVTLTGVLDTDTLVVTPVEWSTNSGHRARIQIEAYYLSANTVRVIVGNPSAATATLTAGTWRVSALRTVIV